MNLLRINHFSDISWYAHGLDLFFIVAFIYILQYAIREFKSGNRMYLVIVITAMFYGTILEVSGMIWHGSYTQGEFLMMWNFKQFELFKNSTDMPFYVPMFYPVWLMTSLKLMEPLGIKNMTARAVSIGLGCLILDVPYILIAPHVGFWEWHEWRMYQLWLGWPLLDGLWELTWHAFMFWCLFKVMPRIDGYYASGANNSNLKSLLGWPIALALIVNIVGPLFMVPASVPTVMIEGFRHYPIFVLYVAIAATIFIFSEKEMNKDSLSTKNLVLPALHFITFATMTITCLISEGGFRDYLLVSSVGLFISAMIVYYPRYMARKN